MVLASEPLASHWPKYLQSGFLIGGSKETYYGLPTRRVQCRAHVRPHAIRGRPAALVIPVRPLRRVYCWQAAFYYRRRDTLVHPGAPWCTLVLPFSPLYYSTPASRCRTNTLSGRGDAKARLGLFRARGGLFLQASARRQFCTLRLPHASAKF